MSIVAVVFVPSFAVCFPFSFFLQKCALVSWSFS
jgi:hypothetical protein